MLACYSSVGFSFKLRTFLLSLPKKFLIEITHVVEGLLVRDIIPSRVALLVNDIVMYRRKLQVVYKDTGKDVRRHEGGF